MRLNPQHSQKVKKSCPNCGQLLSGKKVIHRIKQKLLTISLAVQSEVESALDYFRTNHTNPECNVTTCAAALSLTERRVEQIFHEVLGITPKYCLTRMRIKTALWMKQNNPGFRINEIYQHSGFNSQSTFAREFMAILHLKQNARQVHHIKYLLNKPNSLKVICHCPKSKVCDRFLSKHLEVEEVEKLRS